MAGFRQLLGFLYQNIFYRISIKLRLRILIWLIVLNVAGLGFYTAHRIGQVDQQVEQLTAQDDGARQQIQAVSTQLRSVRTQLGWATFIILAVGAVYAFLILRSVISPLEALRQRVLSIVADADLSRRIDHQANDELGAMMAALDTLLAKFQAITREVNTTTGRVSASMGEMSVIADETNGAVVEQQRGIAEITGLVEQLNQTVDDVTSKIQSASEAANQADQEAGEGREVITSSIQAIEQLAAEVEQAGAMIQTLDERGKSIGAVVDLIREVADQTNLLALNAAIEAARAGDQGRGFAVVADEVRNLASRTQGATQEIQNTIDQVMTDTARTVLVMENGRKQARLGVDQVLKAGKYLELITRDVSIIKGTIGEITAANQRQSTVADDVHRNITAIRNVSDRTAEHAHQTSSASTELTHLAGQLEQQVGQFKV